MDIRKRRVMILGGAGLVGTAISRRLLEHGPSELMLHGLYADEMERAVEELADDANGTEITTSFGDIFGLGGQPTALASLGAQLGKLKDEDLGHYSLYKLLLDKKPDVVVDCVNTATAIAYRNIFRAAEAMLENLAVEGEPIDPEIASNLIESLYIPRLIRHVQILYRGMQDAGTRVYVKIGTTGTGGMGLNVPYTHSEEKPSRVLLSKGAVAGAHSMLLFLMGRTPDGPIIKEIKPAAAIGWKEIGVGPVMRKREVIRRVRSAPSTLGETFSSHDESCGEVLDEALETVYINTGENGVFSLEEFALLTTAEQMEFVTPEEIADNVLFEIEGGNTGHDIINALDGAVLGPTYRAGLMRHWALERMNDLEAECGTRSVAFEMLGPPRNSKLLFESHLLRESFESMKAIRESTPEQVVERLKRLLIERPELSEEVISIGLPILLDSGEIIRGPQVIVPANLSNETVTPEKIELWARDGWVDLRKNNCARWIERLQRIFREVEGISSVDTSSRYSRHRGFWRDGKIQPGKLVGWILATEEQGSRIKR